MVAAALRFVPAAIPLVAVVVVRPLGLIAGNVAPLLSAALAALRFVAAVMVQPTVATAVALPLPL